MLILRRFCTGGVLLCGPPGTGKTMPAKSMASESDVTFITAEGNQFLKRYVGGRAAELVNNGEKDGVSTGASGDLASATALARQFICSVGRAENRNYEGRTAA